jgi:hypothetical protein
VDENGYVIDDKPKPKGKKGKKKGKKYPEEEIDDKHLYAVRFDILNDYRPKPTITCIVILPLSLTAQH